MHHKSGQNDLVNSPQQEEITYEALQFVMNHAYCVDSTRGYYRDDYRRFIVELRRRYAEIDIAVFVEAVLIPAGTIEGWIRATEQSR